MLDLYSAALVRRRWAVIAAGIAVLLVGIFYGIGVFDRLKGGGLDDPSAESAREAREFASTFPTSQVSLLVLLDSATLKVDQPEYRTAAEQALGAIRQQPADILSTTSFFETNDDRFVSRDRRQTYVVIALRGDEAEQRQAYLRLLARLPKTSLRVTVGGPVVADFEIDQQVQRDIPHAESISGPITLILLALLFRSAVAATLPLLIGAVSVLGAFAVTRILAGHMDISSFAPNIISLLGLGLAIDYSLLFVSRFRDELATGRDTPAAIAATIRTAGESIFFSGSTVAISLLGMLLFPESFLRSMGVGGAIATAVAVAAALTVLPAILAVLGPNVNRGRLPGRRNGKSSTAKLPWQNATAAEWQSSESGFWFRLSHWVMRRAVLVIAATLALLLLLGVPFLHTRLANEGIESLPPGFASRITAEALQKNFAVGSASPIQIVATFPGSPLEENSLASLVDYVARLRRLHGVVNVESLVSVDARIPADKYGTFYAMAIPAAEDAKAHFAQGKRTLIEVQYSGDASDASAQALVKQIRALKPPVGATTLTGGDTAALVDRLDSLYRHLPTAGAAIVAATFALLCLQLRSLFVPIKAVVLNILSLAASFGLMTWIFQDGHLENLLAFRSSGSLDVTLPVLIFCLAFGLATDYEVFLVSRIREEYLRTHDNTEAVAHGVEKTGRIITSAALLLIVVVAAFGASEILPMKEIGVGLSIAVFIDAAIVRTLLVPATMRVFGDLNWWLPPFMRRRGIVAQDKVREF